MQKSDVLRRMLPGIVISLALIGAIVYFVDWRMVWTAFQKANYAFFAIGFVMGFVWLLVRAQIWRTLLRDKVSYRDVFLTMMEGYMLNNVLPFRLGEIGRAFLLSRKSSLRFVEILPTIIIERVTDVAFSAAILIAAVPFVVKAQGAEQIAFTMGGLVLVGLLAMYLLARNRLWALDVFHKLSHRWPLLQRVGGSFLESFLTGLEVLTDPWVSARFFGLMTLNWGMAIVQYYLLCLAFFPLAQPVWGMFLLGAAAFGGAIPSLPGGVGTLDSAFAGALTALSGDQATSVAAAIVGRFSNYVYSFTVGLYALSREGQTISGIYQELMKMQEKKE